MTDQKKTPYQALKEAFAKAFHCSPVIKGISDLETGEYVELNQAFYDKLGFTPEEAIGACAHKLVRMDFDFKERALSKLKKEHAIHNEEATIYTKNGSLLYVLISAEVIEIENKKYNLTTAIDITDLKKTEKYLRLRESYISALYQAKEILFIADPQTAFQQFVNILGPVSNASRTYIFLTHANENGKLLFSQRAEYCAQGIQPQIDNPDLQNMSYDNFFPRWLNLLGKGEIIVGNIKDFPKEENDFLALQQIQSILVIPILLTEELIGFIGFDHCLSDQGWDVVEQHFLRAAANDLAQFIERNRAHKQIAEDITERKQAEKALRNSEEKYRLLVDNASDAIFVIQDGFIKFSNQISANLAEYSNDELSKMSFLDMVHPDDREDAMHRYKRQLTGEDLDSHYSCRIINRSGSILNLRIHSLPIQWEGRTAVLAFVNDITKQLELESRLRQSQKMEAIGTLAGGIAHDFNNVLYAIAGYTEIVRDDMPEESLARRNLNEVLKGATRAQDMIQQILAFSRKADAEKTPIKIQAVILEALKLLRTSIPSTIEIRQNIDATCGPIVANLTQIHQIVVNLATNAYQSMKKGGVLEVTLSEESIASDELDLHLDSGHYLKLTISDTGHGMTENVLAKIFDPYFTTKGPGEGSGMGLAVVHGIVRQHGGDIEVHSKPDEGTTFHLYFPLIEPQPAETKPMKDKSIPTGTERILFSDDDKQIMNMVQQMLKRLGYQVTVCQSGTEALDLFKANPDEYDLLITDMTMPKMTGAELTTHVKKIRPDIPVILCTGYSDTINKGNAASIGISAYLRKPIRKKVIAKTIRNLLDADDQKQVSLKQ